MRVDDEQLPAVLEIRTDGVEQDPCRRRADQRIHDRDVALGYDDEDIDEGAAAHDQNPLIPPTLRHLRGDIVMAHLPPAPSVRRRARSRATVASERPAWRR